jgi:gamma-glutamylcyclotransferase (GGCT)/AIG2-like uncharacterized protein YtfP
LTIIRKEQLDMKPHDLLFVYGSLRRGRGADLSGKPGATFVSEDRINGRLYDVAWFPGVLADPREAFDHKDPAVIGEVFEVGTEGLIASLDAYEGYPHLFDRCVTKTEGGRDVWVYTYNRPVAETQFIPSGDYNDVREMEIDES